MYSLLLDFVLFDFFLIFFTILCWLKQLTPVQCEGKSSLQRDPAGGSPLSWSFQWILCAPTNPCTANEQFGHLSSIVLGVSTMIQHRPERDPSLCSLVQEV